MSTKLSYGPVIVVDGVHRNRIGYYEDTDYLYSDDEDLTIELTSRPEWTDLSATSAGLKSLRMCIVYFGSPIIASKYHIIHESCLREVNSQDLLQRHERLSSRLLSPKTKRRHRISYLEELHLIDGLLIERLFNAKRTQPKRGLEVFVSHSSKDKTLARCISVDIAAAGHTPWLDEWKIKAGDSIPIKISVGLDRADVILLLLSQNSVGSKWVENEWAAAYWNMVSSSRVRLIPVLLGDCDVPSLVKHLKYIDFRSDYACAIAGTLDALVPGD